jgi:hypothetical protein
MAIKRTKKTTLSPNEKGNASKEKISDIMRSLEDAKRYGGSMNQENTNNKNK